MTWQDQVIAMTQVLFVLALLPSLQSENKPDWLTSLATTVGMFAIACTYATLSLWFSAGVALVAAALFIQVVRVR